LLSAGLSPDDRRFGGEVERDLGEVIRVGSYGDCRGTRLDLGDLDLRDSP
jgi:hypothetical protein